MVKNPHELIGRLANENPTASADEIERLFLDEVADDPELSAEVQRRVFNDLWNKLHPTN